MIHIWTDGSNSPKSLDNPIGYAAVIDCGDDVIVDLAAWCHKGTNNTAELKAAIIGLQAVNAIGEITVHTDSEYVLNQAMGNHRTKANLELVAQLQKLRAEHNAVFEHCKGHSGITMNERADQLAVWARHQFQNAAEAGAESVLVKCDYVDRRNGTLLLSKEQDIREYEHPECGKLVLRV